MKDTLTANRSVQDLHIPPTCLLSLFPSRCLSWHVVHDLHTVHVAALTNCAGMSAVRSITVTFPHGTIVYHSRYSAS